MRRKGMFRGANHLKQGELDFVVEIALLIVSGGLFQQENFNLFPKIPRCS
jgi:hypothetical protein